MQGQVALAVVKPLVKCFKTQPSSEVQLQNTSWNTLVGLHIVINIINASPRDSYWILNPVLAI